MLTFSTEKDIEKIKYKRILFVIPHLCGGGAERVVATLSSVFAEKGIKIAIMVDYNSDNEYKLSEKVEVIRLNTKKKKNSILRIDLFVKRIYKRRKLTQKFNPDIIMPILTHTTILTYLQNIFLKTKFVSSIVNNPKLIRERGLKGRVMHIMRDLIAYFSDAIFVQNYDQKLYFPKFVQKKVFVVPNPINSSFFSDVVKERRELVNIVTAGRLIELKNHVMGIKAVTVLLKKNINVNLKIFGDGEMREELQEFILQLNQESNILLMGRCDNLPKEYENADIFILTSDTEGMPNALLEAMAAGVPVISTDCPTGPSDIIINNENGILIPVGDVEALANAMECLIKNPDKANKMAEIALKLAKERYTEEVVANMLISELSRVLYN